MPKKKLTDIAEEYEISFEEAQDLVTQHLEEEMVTGRGKGTWINEMGQRMFDDMVPIDVIYRGKVLQQMINPRYVNVYIKELTKRVNVVIPLRFTNKLVGKIIHIEADNKGPETIFRYKQPKMYCSP
tara:strand:+ start:1264 stop:1644 length:381 start_codon:yes stop_codon:yes gene_type:complete